jgi:hypothetical protein
MKLQEEGGKFLNLVAERERERERERLKEF